METYRCSTQIIRSIVSLIAAFYINLHGHWHELGRAFTSPAFYRALVMSFSAAYMMMYWVHAVSDNLNLSNPFRRNWFIRIMLQFALGLVPLLFADLFVITIYFELQGRDIDSTGYMIDDFPIVGIFLAFLNGFHVWIGTMHFNKKDAHLGAHDMLPINYNGIHILLNVSTDVLVFYRDTKLIKVYTSSGEEYSIKDTIGNLNRKYRSINFFQINPSAIVNLNAVQGYTSGGNRDTLQVLYKIEYQPILKKLNPKILRVTKYQINNFKTKLPYLTGHH